jgi:hypothetical protein
MTTGPAFEEYLASKKIDSEAFRKAEPHLWNSWRSDFEQTHPNSFTVQKLNLINPVRRKFQLIVTEIKQSDTPLPVSAPAPVAKPGKPVMGKPVFGKPVVKPKPDVDPASPEKTA